MAGIEVIRSIPAVQPCRPAATLTAVRHIRKMRGGTQAHLMRASDGNLWIVKFQNNPHHKRSLASEFLATRIGLHLGLPMPRVEVIEVPDSLVLETPELYIENIKTFQPCSSGPQLAVRYASDPDRDILIDGSFNERLISARGRQEFAKVLVFDKWTGNCDVRQAVFQKPLAQRGEYTLTFIDQHFCFNGWEWTFPDLPIMGTCAQTWVYRDVMGWNSFEPALSRCETFAFATLCQIAARIPPEWYGDAEALISLIHAVYERRLFIRDVIAQFRDCRAENLFPHWME